MFSVQQIKEAHSKVKSGADFPAYIKDLKKLGVKYYETFVMDGHTDFYGGNDFYTTSSAKYDALFVAETSNLAQFKGDLKGHQNGTTDYPTFCNDSAKSGIEKWVVSTEEMTCTCMTWQVPASWWKRFPSSSKGGCVPRNSFDLYSRSLCVQNCHTIICQKLK